MSIEFTCNNGNGRSEKKRGSCFSRGDPPPRPRPLPPHHHRHDGPAPPLPAPGGVRCRGDCSIREGMNWVNN